MAERPGHGHEGCDIVEDAGRNELGETVAPDRSLAIQHKEFDFPPCFR